MGYERNTRIGMRCNKTDLEQYNALAKVKNVPVGKMIREFLNKEIAENKEAIDEYLKNKGK